MKQEWASRKSNACLLNFSIAEKSSTKSLCFKAKRLVNIFTEKFSKNFKKLNIKNNWALHPDKMHFVKQKFQFLANKNISVAYWSLFEEKILFL